MMKPFLIAAVSYITFCTTNAFAQSVDFQLRHDLHDDFEIGADRDEVETPLACSENCVGDILPACADVERFQAGGGDNVAERADCERGDLVGDDIVDGERTRAVGSVVSQ